ncbi:MAG: pyridoxamine 5'-phosphate oxidase family protein [gamma proteobacterium symbiont of Ctena orbiculata]
MLDADIKKSIEASVLCWLATATPDGNPNVSPKEMFVHYGEDAVIIANIASPRSVANIKSSSSVCVSFIDVFKQKGFKLTGKATIVEKDDAEFEPLLNELHKLGGENFPVRSIIKVAVEEAEPIVAPSYWLFPGTTEQSQIEQAMETYGVRPKIRRV